MADLTLRSVKGSPLTNTELDGNFEYFTGSHAVTGSLTVTEDLIISGSIIGNISGSVNIAGIMNATPSGVQITGSLVVSGSNTFTNVGPMKTGAANNVAAGFAFAQGSMVSASGLYSHAEGFDTNASGIFSHAEGQNTLSQGGSSHAEGVDTSAIGDFSHAEGYGTISSGHASHAEGYFTLASASYQHTQGIYNIASDVTGAFIIGNGSGPSSRSNLIFAAGNQVEITGSLVVTGGITGSLSGTVTSASFASTSSYALTAQTLLGSVVSASFASTASYISPSFISASAAASGFGSGGGSTINTGSFATTGSNAFFGNQSVSGSVTVTGSINHVGSLKTGVAANVALNTSLANGFNVSASGEYSHAEGYYVNAKSQGSHAEGSFSSAGLPAWDTNSTVNGITQLPTSIGNITSSIVAGATVVLGNIPYAANYLIVSRSFFQASRTQIEYVSASNLNASSGVPLAIIDMNNILATYPNQTLTTGEFSHVEGSSNLAIFGHAEGEGNLAFAGHAEGNGTISRGYASHAEGGATLSLGIASHAEGYLTTASGDYSHAEGRETLTLGNYSHAEGFQTVASGSYSHAEGWGTSASGSYQHVQGTFNVPSTTQGAFIIGNGVSDFNRSNLLIAASNQVQITGSLSVTGGITGTVTTASYINPTFISASAAAAGFGSGGGSTIDTGSFATTGSNAFFGNQSVSGSVTVTGSINHVGSLKTGDNANNLAINNSLAQGSFTSASGQYSHAEGEYTVASGYASHTEGYFTNARDFATHAEGYYTNAGLTAWDTNGTFNGLTQLPSSIGNITSSFAPGTTVILGTNYLKVSRSFFQSNLTQVQYVDQSSLNLSAGVPLALIDSTVYPNQTLKTGQNSHAEGESTLAVFGHAEGVSTIAIKGHAEGENTISIGAGSHAEGYNTTASSDYSHAEGYLTKADGPSSHAEGRLSRSGLPAWQVQSTVGGVSQLPPFVGNITSSFTPGDYVILGNQSYVVSRSFFESNVTKIEYVNQPSLVGGGGVPLALVNNFTSWPNQTSTVGSYAHAEGLGNVAANNYTHAEGNGTKALGQYSHTEGGFTVAIGAYSHAEGFGTIAKGDFQHVGGLYNTEDSSSLFIIGNGDTDNARKDAFKVRMSGSIVLPTTQSAAPSWTGTDGEMVFATVTGDHYFYVWMSGAWRSGSLA